MSPVPHAAFSSLAILALLSLVFAIVLLSRLRGYLGLTRGQAVNLGFGTFLAAFAVGCLRWIDYIRVHPHGPQGPETVLPFLAQAFLVLFAVPFGLKLYRAWLGIFVRPDEALPGAPGFRAWLSPMNIALAVLIAWNATAGLDANFMTIFSTCILALVVFPIITTALTSDPTDGSHPTGPPMTTPPSHPPEDLSSERDKILSMLEAGKITAEESAELLNALAGTRRRSASPGVALISGARRLLYLGAALVLLGFFLPWFSANPSRELQRATGQLQGMFSDASGMSMSMIPELEGVLGKLMPKTIDFTGGDIGNGLGWIVLLLALAVAALPHLAYGMEPRKQRLFSLAALGVGAFILLYLFARGISNVHVCFFIVVAGYVVEFLSFRRPPPASPDPAVGARTA